MSIKDLAIFKLVVDKRTNVCYYDRTEHLFALRAVLMSKLKEVITTYNELSFSDRIAFYTTISNEIGLSADMQSFLIEKRLNGGNFCIYCNRTHVVKNGKRKDGTQRYLCRDCHRSFIPTSDSITSRTRKSVSVWASYLKCMTEKKTLRASSDECHISVATAFVWRHKILDALSELTDKAYLTGIVEADETFFNVSYKGNHKRSRRFSMPRRAHKRGNDVHAKGLSAEEVCVPCAINDAGISCCRPGKPGKISTKCINDIFSQKIAPGATLCTDRERAYLDLARRNGLKLIQMDADCRMVRKEGAAYGIQRVSAYHSRLKDFIRTFHGVSTKHLGNYISWHDLLSGDHRDRKEFVHQLWGQMLCARITRYGSDISDRSPLPSAA